MATKLQKVVFFAVLKILNKAYNEFIMEMFQKGASPFRCSNSIFKEEYMGEKRYIISDASKMLNVESHVLRYWEEELEIKIPRNEMGHRYYTEGNLESLRKVRDLKKQGYSQGKERIK